jgi:NADH dehydrogenase (ubiquinone) 1 alpha subcomplex subunit 5
MRSSLRLLAEVAKPRYLEAGTPTGLAGLLTHPSPRTTLLYVYNNTLERLKQLPESSVYRQSTENLTRHRMSIIEKVKPEGLAEWQTRVQKSIDANPTAFRKIPLVSAAADKSAYNIIWKAAENKTSASEEAQGGADVVAKAQLEGPRDEETKKHQAATMQRDLDAERRAVPTIEPEPPLTAAQIGEIEQEIRAGLIEEVIQVAEGERMLVDTLLEHEVYVFLLVPSQCRVTGNSVEDVLTVITDGKTSRRSRQRANGRTTSATHMLAARRHRHNRCCGREAVVYIWCNRYSANAPANVTQHRFRASNCQRGHILTFSTGISTRLPPEPHSPPSHTIKSQEIAVWRYRFATRSLHQAPTNFKFSSLDCFVELDFFALVEASRLPSFSNTTSIDPKRLGLSLYSEGPTSRSAALLP